MRIDQTKPVLLQQGFPVATVRAANPIDRKQYIAKNNRGRVKFFDILPNSSNPVLLNDNIRFTLSAGGQILIKDDMLGMWAITAQSGKDKRWRIRTDLAENQTIDFTLDSTQATLQAAGVNLIASYTTPEHEAYLKQFKMPHGLGLKRQTYVLKVPAGAAVGDIINIEDILPRNNGTLIGFGISNTVDTVTDDILKNQIINLTIEGINVVETMPATYYNTASGRDTFIQPMFINAGDTFNFSTTIVGVPNAIDIYQVVTFYFGN